MSAVGIEEFCSDIFNKTRIFTQDNIDEALREIDVKISAPEIEPFILTLLSTPFSETPFLELVLSTPDLSSRFESWILAKIVFPLAPSSLNLLSRLSNFLLFSPFSYERETSIIIAEHHRWVEQTPAIISAVKSMDFSNRHVFIEQGGDNDDDDNDDMGWGIVKRKTTQRQRKQLKKSGRIVGMAEINVKLFSVLGLSVPRDEVEAETTSRKVFAEIKNGLRFFLKILRRPDIASNIREMIVTSQVPPAAEIGQPAHTTDDFTETVMMKVPSAFPALTSFRALYFDSATGFGEWRILISTRADRDLREARRRDAKFFKVIIKKIKELSNGHFSDDNQKRLNGTDMDIPIYEAKMTRDSRLIYQVDCIPEFDSEVERQVLKIFGIYTHAQINKRLWNSLARQLGRKGKQYRDRCIYRNQPYHPGDNVVQPACFPPREYQEENTSPVPNLPQEDLEEIHSLLVLEKFVTFSQALLNTLIPKHLYRPQEKEIIEHPTSCYVLGRSGTGKTTTMLFKMLGIERAFDIKATDPKPRQLFVTQSRVLATRVEEYFVKLLESLSAAGRTPQELIEIAKRKKEQREEEGLIDIDDDTNWRADLPSRFSLLDNNHFPLFLTFDRLLQLLEADMNLFSTKCLSAQRQNTLPYNSSVNGGQLITYSVFLELYWPHFSQTLTRGLDPSLVFSELVGVIEGSEETLSQEKRFLDKVTYENLSHRAQHTFATQRGAIYDIFNAYLKHKRTRGDFDAADRTHRVLQALQLHGILGQKLDFLYVDEAQDNLLIDAFLLRLLCRNSNGLFWAGDTAQTISVGSCFRFDDLKAFLFRLEHRKDINVDRVPQYLHEPPKSFQLAINYRSHGGIVQCAHSIIELITTFWPYAIDMLTEEHGVVDGSKPVFFSGWDQETIPYEQFLFGTTGTKIEFGAQQCILVRNETARDELKCQVGDIGLIMTLYESKGLEFDDVLLYKFFEDSTVDLSQWRVVLNLLENSGAHNLSTPRFNEVRHAGVCSELKFLYVAITRARKNLWIVDCSERCEPMKVLWTSRNQVQNCTPGTDVPQLAASSTPEEWEKMGRTLFQNKRYLQAMHCFDRAGIPRKSFVAHTYYLREQARMMPDGGSRQDRITHQQAYIKAADAFLKCASEGGNKKETIAYFRASGNCFERAQNDRRAAQAYYNAEDYSEAVQLYRKCGLFDEAVDIVMNHRGQVKLDVANGVIDVARLFYYQENNLEKAKKLFSSTEEELEYLEEYDLDVARAGVLDRIGRFREAADIHLAEGRVFQAIQLFLKEEQDEESMSRASKCILQGLWEIMTFGVVVEEEERNHAERLLQLAFKLKYNPRATLTKANEQFDMFEAILAGDSTKLLDLGRSFAMTNATTLAVLCFDYHFKKFPSILNSNAEKVATILGDFLLYTELLNDLRKVKDPCNNRDIQKLFGFRLSSDNVFFVPAGTYLHLMTGEIPIVLLGRTESGVLISEANLANLYKRCVGKYLRIRVSEEDSLCRGAEAFSPCLSYASLGYCNRPQCPRQHLEAVSLTPSHYNVRVRIHLQQILIAQSLYATRYLTVPEERLHQKYWIEKLHQTLYPSLYCLGSISNLNTSNIPEAQKAIRVVRRWVQQLVYFPFHLTRDLVTTVYRLATLGMLFDKSNAPTYLERAPILNEFLVKEIFLRAEKGRVDKKRQSPCIMHELVESLQAKREAFISMGILFVRCRTLGLLGYNLNNIGLRDNIMKHLKLVRPLPETRAPVIYRPYAEARSWSDIARAVRRSTMNSTLDDLVQLQQLETTNSPHTHAPVGVQRLLYRVVEDIPHLLGNGSLSAFLSDLRVDAPTFFPRNNDSSITEEPENPASDVLTYDIGEEIEELEVDSTVILSATALADSIANNVTLETNTAPSSQQLKAAMVILATFRRARQRKEAEKAALNVHFVSCLTESKSMDWPTRYYRLMFLGPLPHALVCLDAIYAHCVSTKEKTKKQLPKAIHQELENLGKRLTEINTLLKDCKRLQKLLHPKSHLHRKHDGQELKHCILEVERMVHCIPPVEGLLSNLVIVLKGIVANRRLPSSKPKPDLCIEDDAMLYTM
ncbi:hypothetical protein BDQ17DRAFT_1418043 [Cyathus striatus]|nr:hypothetical protein BDQ17DRAFT_1418043 [Cyathus striatus]